MLLNFTDKDCVFLGQIVYAKNKVYKVLSLLRESMLLVIVKNQYSHLACAPTYASNNKPVKIWAQLVVEVARKL